MAKAEENGYFYHRFDEVWNIQKKYVSDKTLDYIDGVADGADVSPWRIGYMWIWEGVMYPMGCTSFAVEGLGTKSNNLIHVRSLDGHGYLEDPVTGIYAQEAPVLVVCDPIEDFAFMYPSVAGYFVEDGINERGISVCNLWSVCSDNTLYGSPMGVRLFEALYSSSNASQAIEIITSNNTFGYNFIVCDGQKNDAYVIAVSYTHLTLPTN